MKSKKVTKQELKKRLRDKLNFHKLSRTTRFTRNNEMETLEKELRNKKITPKSKKALKERLALLEKLEERDMDNFENTLSGDFVE